MLAWSEGTDNGRQKTRNHGYDYCRRRAIYRLLRSPSQTCHAGPKNSNQQAPDATSFFPAAGCLPQAVYLKDFSPKSQDAVALQQSWRAAGALPMIDRRYPSGNRPRCSNIRASLPGAGYGQFEHKADARIAKFKEAGGTVREIDVWAESPRLSPLIICIIVCLSWAVNQYRDNAITYKAQRDKNARELKLANAAITDMQMRQRDVAALDAKYTKELATLKLVARRGLRDEMRHYHRLATRRYPLLGRAPPGVTALPPTGRHRWIGLFPPSERLITMQKQLEGTQKYINEQCMSCPYRWATHAIIVSTHTRFQRSINVKVIKPSNPFTNVCWVSVLTTFSAPPQILSASTVFFCPIQKRRNDGWWFPWCYCCRFVLNSKRLLSTS